MRTSTQIALTGHKTNNMVVGKKKKAKSKELKSKKTKRSSLTTDEVDAPRKKKKRKKVEEKTESKELTKAEQLRMKKIRKRIKLLRSSFKDAVPRIHQLISEDNLPAAMSSMSRSFLIMLTGLIPLLEQTVKEKPGQSSVYSLNALVSQVREIQADIKADSDQASLAERICEEIVARFFLEYSQKMALSFYHLREQLRPMIATSAISSFDSLYNQRVLDVGSQIEQLGEKVKEKIAETLTLE